MRSLLDIRDELRAITRDPRRKLDEDLARRIQLELMVHQAVLLHQINAANGGDPDWRYEEEIATTTSSKILEVKKGDLVMVRLKNWDDQELRALYYGLDGPVASGQGRPLQPGEEQIFMANADLWVVSPSAGTLIRLDVGLDSNDVIPFSEDGWATTLLARIAAGRYESGQDYARAIETALLAAGTSVYTVAFNPTTRTYTYTSDGSGGLGTFDLGYGPTRTLSSVSNAFDAGFNPVDKTGLLAYSSDFQVADSPLPLRVGKAIPFKKRDRDFF